MIGVIEPLVSVLRTGLRPWRWHPGLALAIVASLALAMAVGLTMSSVLTTVSQQVLTFPNGHQLVRPMRRSAPLGTPRDTVSSTGFVEWRGSTRGFASLAAYQREEAQIQTEGWPPSGAAVARVSGNLFATLGVRALAGRTLRAEDEGQAACAVVLTRSFAARTFGSVHGALDRPLRVDAQSCRVAGVVDDRFAFPTSDVEIFAPANLGVAYTKDEKGRMSVTIAQVQVIGLPKAAVPQDLLAAEVTTHFNSVAGIVPFDDALSASYRRTLDLLWLCSLIVFGVAVFNVATVMSTQAVARLGEWSVRGALGASGRALWFEMTAESAVVCLAGAVAGLALATVVFTVMRAEGPVELRAAALSWQTSGVWLLLTCLLTLAAPLPAWWQAVRLSTAGVGTGARQTMGAARSQAAVALGPLLLVTQLGGAIGLITIALVFAGTLRSMFLQPRGFTADTVIVMPLRCASGLGRGRCVEQVDAARRRLETDQPGSSVAVTNDVPVPVSSRPFSMQLDDEERGEVMNDEDDGQIRLAAVSANYFDVMGTRILAGRRFGEQDGHGTALVAIVSASLARSRFGSVRAALGRPVPVASLGGAHATVVGVAEDVRRSVWDARELPVIYAHYKQVDAPGTRHPVLLLKPQAPPVPTALMELPRIARLAAPDVQIGTMRTVRAARIEEVSQTAAYLGVATAFACVTLFLVSLGVFASTASLVTRRSAELAIRQAVGATPRRARQAVLSTVGRWWVSAVVAGVGLAWAGGRLVASWQVGLIPITPGVVGASVLLITATMALAAWVPLRQALRIEPATLMRRD